MFYSSGFFANQFERVEQVVEVPQLSVGNRLASIVVTKTGGSFDVLIMTDLPETPDFAVSAVMNRDKSRDRSLAVASYLVSLPRAVLLDMVRDNLSAWTLESLGVDGSRDRHNNGIGTPLDCVPEYEVA